MRQLTCQTCKHKFWQGHDHNCVLKKEEFYEPQIISQTTEDDNIGLKGYCRLVEAVISSTIECIKTAKVGNANNRFNNLEWLAKIPEWAINDQIIIPDYCTVFNKDIGKVRNRIMNLATDRIKYLKTWYARK